MTGPYLYQTIHTLDGHPLWLAEHIEVLNTASRALFGRPFATTPEHLAQQTKAMLATERLNSDRSIFVRMILTPSGELHLQRAEVSLYRGYALRCLTPDAVSMRYDLPFGEYPHSGREALAELALTQAARHHAHAAVRCTQQGVVLTCDDAPLYAVCHGVVTTSPAPHSVERMLAARSIAAAGLSLTERPILQEELPHLDELFTFDHRGVTALARCDGHPYMSLAAERTARAAERLTNG